uniref:Si:ch211-241j12.3 n=1 Tax=Fundulus heteroclitus TaxID=8078 RepID=A0A3Q2PV41_FUNHE
MSQRAAGIHTPLQECGPSAPLPADRVLGSGAVLFPGVFDQHGCPLVIFPADGQDRLLELSKAEVVDFINYFHALFNRKYEKQSLVSVVVDLRNASPPTPKFIMESLLLVQEHKRTIHSVYLIQPKKKDVVKPLLKLLNLSMSCSASFKTILLREIPELWNYIDRSQLPASLGGYFLYCHRSWVSFIKEIHAFVQEFLSVVQRLPSCISTLQALSRLPLPSSFSELQYFCCTNEAKFLQLRRELGLDELLKHCETVCEKLRHPDRELCYQAMVGTPLFTQTAFEMLQNHSRITAAVDKVELLWQQAFSKAHLQLQVLQLRHGALQIIVKMESLQEKLQLYKMEMAKDSAAAEMVLSEFEASISTPAMALVRSAEDVIDMLKEILPVKFQTRECWALGLEKLKEELRSAVNFIHQTLSAVCDYHNYYNKANTWYSLVLRDNFLPELLSGVHGDQLSSWRQTDDLKPVPAWRQRLFTFLKKNPPPDIEELLHLSRAIPDDEVQLACRRLSQRCMVLRMLLLSSGPVSVEQLQLALKWQYELLRTSHVNPSPESDGLPKWSPSDLNHTKCDNRPEAENHRATLASPAAFDLVSPAWKQPSADTFYPGLDSVGSTQLETLGRKDVENFLKLTGNSYLMRTAPGQPNIHGESPSSTSKGEHNKKEIGSGPAENLSSASIQIIPKVEAESLNLEITVKRSAAPQTNPWLSLPVDDLENSYTVTITPKPTPQKKEASQKQSSEVNVAVDQESGCSDQLAQMEMLSCTEPREPQSTDWMLHAHSGLEDPEHSPGCNILSSTFTDGRDRSICGSEGVPTLLWDSYDLHDEKPEADSVTDTSLMDWEVKEQENLREVEKLLNKADGILEEEENVLVQEAVLDALLRAGNTEDPWPLWASEEQLDEASIELAESSVLSFDDCLQPEGSRLLSEVMSPDSTRESEAFSDDDDDDEDDYLWTKAENAEGHFDNRRALVNEMKTVHDALDQMIKENLNIHDLRPYQEGLHNPPTESTPLTSQRVSVANTERGAFSLQLESEKREVRSSVEAPEGKDGAQQSGRYFVTDQSETDSSESGEPTDEQCEGPDGGWKAAMNPQATDVFEEKPSRSQGHVGPSDCELSFCNTGRVSSFCDLKESSVVVQPLIICGKYLHESTPCIGENTLTSGLVPHGEVDPGGNPVLPVTEPETGSLPVNSPPAQHENPPAPQVCGPGSSLLAQDPAYTQQDLKAEALGGGLERVIIDDGKNIFNPNVKEHNKNNNNLSLHGNGNGEPSEMTNVDEKDPSMVPVGLLQTDMEQTKADLQSVLKNGPNQPLEFDPSGTEELTDGVQSSDSMRMSDRVAQRIQTALWEDNIEIWQHTFQQLPVDPRDHPVLLTEKAMNPLENRQRMVEIMFEHFGVPFAYVAMQAVLALYAVGRTTGVVFDSGEGVSHSVPVFEGYSLPHAVQRFPLAGLDVTLQLKKLLQEQGVCMHTTAEDQIVREMKEKCCCVSLNYEAELNPERSSCREMHYTMPDGQIITLGTERFRAPEILFKPEMIGREHYGMHENIFKSIFRSDIDLRRSFLGNIVLSGGNTLLPGLPERLQAEIKNLVPADMGVKVCVTSPKDRDFLVWSGGAVLANLPNFGSAWISQGEYEEYGPQIVFRKCF